MRPSSRPRAVRGDRMIFPGDNVCSGWHYQARNFCDSCLNTPSVLVQVRARDFDLNRLALYLFRYVEPGSRVDRSRLTGSALTTRSIRRFRSATQRARRYPTSSRDGLAIAEARMACSMESVRTYTAPIWRASSRAILVYATPGNPAKYGQHFLIMELQHNDLGGGLIHRDARKCRCLSPVPPAPVQ